MKLTALLFISLLIVPVQADARMVEGSCAKENLDSLLDVRAIDADGAEKSTITDMGLYIHALDDDGNMTVTVTGLPKPMDYPAKKKAPDKIADAIDWASQPDAKTFRTRLSEGLEWVRTNKPDLIDGKYTTVMHGCGTSCQMYWIVNVETGKVLGNITTAQGLHYQLDSRLLIANMMDAVGEEGRTVREIDESEHRSAVGFYIIENDALSLIRLVCTPAPWQIKAQ